MSAENECGFRDPSDNHILPSHLNNLSGRVICTFSAIAGGDKSHAFGPQTTFECKFPTCSQEDCPLIKRAHGEISAKEYREALQAEKQRRLAEKEEVSGIIYSSNTTGSGK